VLTPDVHPLALGKTVKHAKGVVADHMFHMSESLDGYVGRYFNRQQQGRVDDPTNSRFEFIGLFLPNVAGGSPSWAIDSAIVGPAQQMGDAMEIGLASHAVENRYQSLAERLAVDFCFTGAMAVTLPEEQPDGKNLQGGGPLYAPITKRVEMENTFWDVTDTSVGFENSAFRGHRSLRTRRDLKAGDGWNMDAIGRLAEYKNDSKDAQDQQWHDRDVIAYDVIYVPGATAEMVRELGYDTTEHERAAAERPNQYNGWLFYLAQTGKNDMTEFLRDPEPFFGPAMGPYVRFDGFPVPGSTFTGTTLGFTAGQQKALNDAERAVLTAETEYKSIMAYETKSDAVAKKIADTPSGETVALPGLHREGSPLFAHLEFGGATKTMHTTLDRRRFSLDRNLGVSDEQKGVSNSGATATASSIAATAGQSRIGWQAGKFFDGMNLIGYQNAWYMFHDPQYARSIKGTGTGGRFVEVQDGEAFPIPDPVLRGGVTGDEGFSFDDFSFKFNYMSVRHQTEQERLARVNEVTSMIINAAPAMVAAPWVDWATVWSETADGYNMPWIKNAFNYTTLSEMAGAEIESDRNVMPQRHDMARKQFNLAAPQKSAQQPQGAEPQQVNLGPEVQ